MKALNLDALAKAKRTVTLGGVEYVVKEMTVGNFIETTKAADELEAKKDEVTFADQIEMQIALIQRSIPDCPAEALRDLNIEQLVTVSKFLRGELDEGVEGAEEVEGEKKQ